MQSLLKLGRPDGPPAGLHHFTRERDGQVARYHLRVEPDGHATLIANATNAAHLSPAAAALAFDLLRGAPLPREDEHTVRLRDAIDAMAHRHGGYPLSTEGALARSVLSAPLTADVVPGEKTLDVLRTLWDAGVPHVILIADEAAHVKVLTQLVERAEDLGMICGVRARATDLGAGGLDDLAAAGLDHLDLYWGGATEKAHDALFGAGDYGRMLRAVEACHRVELCPTAVTPLTTTTLGDMDEIAVALVGHRVPSWTIYAIAERGAGGGKVLGAGALRQVATTAEELADHHDLNLVWAPPLERDPELPVAEQVRGGPRASSDASLRVEGDGTVRAAVGPHRAAGHLLRDRWADLWGAEEFRRLREGARGGERCEACPGLALCAGGCPADAGTWSAR